MITSSYDQAIIPGKRTKMTYPHFIISHPYLRTYHKAITSSILVIKQNQAGAASHQHVELRR